MYITTASEATNATNITTVHIVYVSLFFKIIFLQCLGCRKKHGNHF